MCQSAFKNLKFNQKCVHFSFANKIHLHHSGMLGVGFLVRTTEAP